MPPDDGLPYRVVVLQAGGPIVDAYIGYCRADIAVPVQQERRIRAQLGPLDRSECHRVCLALVCGTRGLAAKVAKLDDIRRVYRPNVVV